MGQPFLKALYGLHRWLGLGLGLLLYLVCVSGTVALFTAELAPWARAGLDVPATGPAAGQAGLDRQLDRLLGDAGGRAASIFVHLPDRWRDHADIAMQPHGDGPPQRIAVDAADGSPVTPGGSRAAEIVTRLHTDLLLPSPVGRYLVGGLGAAMLVSLISGVLLHRRILSDLFTLRLGRSLRLAWSDSHRSLGLWGLPFHLMMALTGAMLGFAAPALTLAAATAFDGDLDAAFAAIGDPPAAATGADAAPLPASRLLEQATAALPGLVPDRIEIREAGDAGATATVMGRLPGRLVYLPYVVLEAATGRVLSVADWSTGSIGRQVYAAVTPLHYGSYGGLGLKLLYALLGIGTCLLTASGLHIWNSRHVGAEADAARLARRLTGGTVHGLPFAIAGLFLAGRLATGTGAADWMPWLFLALLAAGLAWPWWRGTAAATRDLTRLLALALILQPAGALATGAPPMAVVDLAALATGLALLSSSLRRARRRPQAGGRAARPAPPEGSAPPPRS